MTTFKYPQKTVTWSVVGWWWSQLSFEVEKISQTYLKIWKTVKRYGISKFPTVHHTWLIEARWSDYHSNRLRHQEKLPAGWAECICRGEGVWRPHKCHMGIGMTYEELLFDLHKELHFKEFCHTPISFPSKFSTYLYLSNVNMTFNYTTLFIYLFLFVCLFNE